MAERESLPSRAWVYRETSERFNNLSDIGWSAYNWLLRQGVPSSALVYPELPHYASVIFHTDQALFDFAEDGSDGGCEALVFLARDNTGQPADLVAWSCRLRKLAAHFDSVSTLGADDLLAPRLTPELALPIHRSPLGWLKAGREGVVLLAPDRAVIELRDFGPFAVEDVEHGKQLRQLFRSGEPQIFVPKLRAVA
jgi:hypothetical protein